MRFSTIWYDRPYKKLFNGRLTQHSGERLISYHSWPARPPNPTPRDYFVCGDASKKIDTKQFHTQTALQTSLGAQYRLFIEVKFKSF